MHVGERLSSSVHAGEKELEDIRAAFMKFDNGDGKLDRDELRRAMTQLGDDKLTEQEFDELMQEADVDEDGVIDMSEFISFMTRRSYD